MCNSKYHLFYTPCDGKAMIRGCNGELTGKLLEIMRMHAGTAILDRETTEHITSYTTRVPADQYSTNH